ncbi:MAG TPA: hypothetical protein VGM39_21590 [Kofleriaceae bacterium]|jgi:hypothetical protein
MKAITLKMAALTWIGFAIILAVASGCDPVWGAHVRLRGPDHVPVANALVTVACPGESANTAQGWVVRTDTEGQAFVGSLGTQFPDCDLYIAAAGLPVRRIRYADLCPGGPDTCDRTVDLDLALADER